VSFSGAGAKLELLLVEDNPCDVLLFKQILRKCSVSCSLTVAINGIQAMNYISGHNPGCLSFDAVFLDLNLPCKSGTEVLAEIKADAKLVHTPVAMLTGSDDSDDRRICRVLGADAYFNKAEVMQDFFALVREIDAFLIRVCCGAALGASEISLTPAA
jgi:CheY-like chemotaxis protein